MAHNRNMLLLPVDDNGIVSLMISVNLPTFPIVMLFLKSLKLPKEFSQPHFVETNQTKNVMLLILLSLAKLKIDT